MSVWFGAHWGRAALVALWLVLIWDTPRRAWYCVVVISAGLGLFVVADLSWVPLWTQVSAVLLGVGGRAWAARVTRDRAPLTLVEPDAETADC
jgi:hypothetical protein